MNEDTQVKWAEMPQVPPTKEWADAAIAYAYEQGRQDERAARVKTTVHPLTKQENEHAVAFAEMKCRIRSNGGCEVQFLAGPPGSWPRDRLLIIVTPEASSATLNSTTLGDISIFVTGNEIGQLLALAHGQWDLFTQDLEWKWHQSLA